MSSSPEALVALLAGQGAPESQLRRIAGLCDLARSNDDLLALALVGSYARGTGNRLSDLDLAAIARPEHVEGVLDAVAPTLEAAEVLNTFRGIHPGGGAFRKLVYLDFSSVEFHVFPEGSPFRLRGPYLTLWDPRQILPSLVVPGEPVRHEDFPAFQYGDPGLVWELVDCIKWLSRGENALAKQHLVKLAAKIGTGA